MLRVGIHYTALLLQTRNVLTPSTLLLLHVFCSQMVLMVHLPLLG